MRLKLDPLQRRVSDLCGHPISPSGLFRQQGLLVLSASILQVKFNSTTQADGFYITTTDGPTAKDVSSWCIYGSTSNGSFYSWSCSNDMGLPIGRGVDFVSDAGKCRPFAVLAVSSSFVFSAGFSTIAWLGATGREAHASGVLVAMFLASTAVKASAGLGYFLGGRFRRPRLSGCSCLRCVGAPRAWKFMIEPLPRFIRINRQPCC